MFGLLGCSVCWANFLGPAFVTVARQVLGFFELCWVSLEQMLGFNLFVGLGNVLFGAVGLLNVGFLQA
jgi:hypothetical protein